MGQIVSSAAKPKRCNINQLSQVPTPAAGEHILVSSDNSMNAAGQGNFDCYIVGVGNVAATALPLRRIAQEDSYNLAIGGTKYASLSLAAYDVPAMYQKRGMHIIFLASDGSLQEYQFIGNDSSVWTDESMWTDITETYAVKNYEEGKKVYNNGTIVDDALCGATDFVEVEAGQTYTICTGGVVNGGVIARYNASKVFTDWNSTPSSNRDITIGANEKYLRISIVLANADDAYIKKGNEVIWSPSTSGAKKKLYAYEQELTEEEKQQVRENIGAASAGQYPEIEREGIVSSKDSVIITDDDGNEVATINDNGISSTFYDKTSGKKIEPIEQGEGEKTFTLTSSDFDGVMWGGDKVYASSDSYNGFIIPLHEGANTEWKINAGSTTQIHTFSDYPTAGSASGHVRRLTYGSEFTPQADEKYLLISVNVSASISITIHQNGYGMIWENALANPFYGKKVAFFGSSITSGVGAENGNGRGYPKYMEDVVGCIAYNFGVGGSRIMPRPDSSSSIDSPNAAYNRLDTLNLIRAKVNGDMSEQVEASQYLETMPSDRQYISDNIILMSTLDFSTLDAIVIECFTNDYHSASTIGTDGDGESTCYGCLKSIVEMICTTWPQIQVYLVGTIVGYMNNTISNATWKPNYDNRKGTILAYNAAVKDVAEKHGLPYYDSPSLMGWNQQNFSRYFGTNLIHPETGYKDMAKRIAAFIKSNFN